MIEAYKALVEPAAKKLDRMLRAKYNEDYMVIPVRVINPSGTTQIVEDGMVTGCGHAGATEGNVDIADLYYNPTTGELDTFDRVQWGLQCDKCPAWQDESGEWNE